MAEAGSPKLQTQIDIKSLGLFQPRVSTELTPEELRRAQRVPFPFFRRLPQRKESTWFISLIVIFHLIAFFATMLVNDCWTKSHGECVFNQLGRLSFQPLAENPFLGPSASALDRMGSLRLRYFEQNRQVWRLFASPLLHAGLIHLFINLSCVILVGIQLEQEFGPMRIGVIYILSALTGSLFATLFLHDRPSVASSGALFGLIGAAVSGLIQNHKVYTRKLATLFAFLVISVVHVGIGLMPFINNFSNFGGFLSGLLVSSALLLKPQVRKVYQNKVGIFEYNAKNSNKNTMKMSLKFDLDKPITRSVSLLIFSLILAGSSLAILRSINLTKSCSWCKYIDCIPFKWWSCSDKTMTCEAMISSSYESTLTCLETGRFLLLPYVNISHARIEDLCYVICS